MENERRHGRAVPAGIDRIVTFEVVRVIDDEPSLKPAVCLQWKPIEQGDDGETGSRFLG